MAFTRFRRYPKARHGLPPERLDKPGGYTPDFKRQIVGLARSGRTAVSLAHEFGPSVGTIALWVKQIARDGGDHEAGLRTTECKELTRLPRENDRLREKHENLASRDPVCNGERRELKAVFGILKANQATHPVGKMCRLLRVSRNDFYAWYARTDVRAPNNS